MTQRSTGTEDGAGDTVAAGSTSVGRPRHPGRRLFGNSGPQAPQPTLVPEQGAPVVTPDARQRRYGRAAAAYTHAAGEGLR
jgi:hypothetical protein